MDSTTVLLRYGPGYTNEINLNDGVLFYCKANDLWAASEREVILAPSDFGPSQFVRGQLKDRVFSLTVAIAPEDELWESEFSGAHSTLAKAVYRPPNEKVRVYVYREGLGLLYLEANPEGIKETKEPGVFELPFTAEDGIFTQDEAQNSGFVDEPSSGVFVPLPVPLYNGTAPAEPVLTLEVLANSQLWHYYRNITVENRSSQALSYYPIAIVLGDVSSWIAAGKLRSDLGDLRLQTVGGINKPIYVRDELGDRTNVKVWFVMYSLAPGETKTVRLLYGNALATAEVEESTAAPIFNMLTSDNSVWRYQEFAALAPLQAHSMQWQPYLTGGANNVQQIDFVHPDFTAPSGSFTNAAGGYVPAYGPASGGAGVHLTTPVPISSVQYQHRTRTNGGKTPFTVVKRTADNHWIIIYSDTADTGQRTTVSTATVIGSNLLFVPSTAGVVAGDTLYIETAPGSGTYITKVVQTVFSATRLDMTTTFSVIIPVGSEVTKYPTGSLRTARTETFTSPYPQGVAFTLYGFTPQYNSGWWYYGAAEWVDVYFSSTAYPNVTVGAEVSIAHHLSGTLTNSLTLESLSLSTVMDNIGDKLVVDCAARTCKFYPKPTTTLTAARSAGATQLQVASTVGIAAGNTCYVQMSDTTWHTTTVASIDSPTLLTLAVALPKAASSGAPFALNILTMQGDDRFDALDNLPIGYYWVHIEPSDEFQEVQFSGDNLYNIRATIEFPTRYY